MTKKAKRPTYITPIGTAVYPWLHKPDTRTFNGEPPKPAYKVSLALEGDEADKFIALIDEWVDASYAEAVKNNPKVAKKIGKAYPYDSETDDDGNETGRTLFKFKQNAIMKFKDGSTKEMKVALFDASGKPIPQGTGVFGGSELRLSYSTRAYYMAAHKSAGITLDLIAAQIIKLVNESTRTADSYGFGAVDGGYAQDDDGFGADDEAIEGELLPRDEDDAAEGDF